MQMEILLYVCVSHNHNNTQIAVHTNDQMKHLRCELNNWCGGKRMYNSNKVSQISYAGYPTLKTSTMKTLYMHLNGYANVFRHIAMAHNIFTIPSLQNQLIFSLTFFKQYQDTGHILHCLFFLTCTLAHLLRHHPSISYCNQIRPLHILHCLLSWVIKLGPQVNVKFCSFTCSSRLGDNEV